MKRITYFDDYEGVVSVERLLKLNDHAHVEAVARYHWASKLISSLIASSTETVTVWDLGCGSGEGSQIIRNTEKAKSLLRVIAVDIYDKAIAMATGRSSDQDIVVARQDLCSPIMETSLLGKNHADVALCFGTLPQLLHREFFFEQLVRFMTPNAMLLLNGDFDNRVICDPKPPAGYFGYNQITLMRLLRRYFELVLGGGVPLLDKKPFAVADYFRQHTNNPELGRDWILCRYPIA